MSVSLSVDIVVMIYNCEDFIELVFDQESYECVVWTMCSLY